MITSTNKSLLHNVIDTLPQNELEVIYKMFESFINDYLDSQMSDEEHKEHVFSLVEIDAGEYVSLSDLKD